MSEHVPVPGGGEGVYWLGDRATREPAIVGDPVACLGRLADLDCQPPAFCLTAPPLRAMPDGSLAAGVAAIAAMYPRLAAVAGVPDPAVVVRSALVGSATAPSWIPAPWSFSNVAGQEALCEAVTECVAPYVSDRASAYRAARSPAAAGVTLAVLVQRFIAADVCAKVSVGAPGVSIVIRSRWGLYELTGSGSGCDGPGGWDITRLRRPDLAVLQQTIADKRSMTVAGDGGVLQVDVPPARRQVACLAAGQARELAELAARIQVRIGRPVEAELAIQDGRPHLLWCEPGQANPG